MPKKGKELYETEGASESIEFSKKESVAENKGESPVTVSLKRMVYPGAECPGYRFRVIQKGGIVLTARYECKTTDGDSFTKEFSYHVEGKKLTTLTTKKGELPENDTYEEEEPTEKEYGAEVANGHILGLEFEKGLATFIHMGLSLGEAGNSPHFDKEGVTISVTLGSKAKVGLMAFG